MKYKYVVNKECRESCDGYYKLETSKDVHDPDDPTATINVPFIKCYDSISDVLSSSNTDVEYYNVKSKLCWKVSPSGYFILKQDSTTPPKYEVVDECEHYYYSLGTSAKYYCTKNCNSIFTEGFTLPSGTTSALYFVKGKKNCEN